MPDHSPPFVSVIVPVFNGDKTLAELSNRLVSSLENSHCGSYEIIFVNDGSRDNSWPTIVDLATATPGVRGINLMKNFGQHNALLAGIGRARGSIIVTLDDDLQHPPEEIPSLLNKLFEGYDVVYGKPEKRQHSFWRNVTSHLLKRSLKVVLGATLAQHSSAFRAFRAELRRGFIDFRDADLALDVLLSWSARNIASVPVRHDPRTQGRSGYSTRKLLAQALYMITGYSTLPLRVASLIGLATSISGFTLFIYVVIRRLVQDTYVPGFAFLAAEMALFAGLQLFALGVIGEYLARIHFRTMGKPTFVIRETAEFAGNAHISNPALAPTSHGTQRRTPSP